MYSELEKKASKRLVATAITEGLEVIPSFVNEEHFYESCYKRWIKSARASGDCFAAARACGIDPITSDSDFFPLKAKELDDAVDTLLEGYNRRKLLKLNQETLAKLGRGDSVREVEGLLLAGLDKLTKREEKQVKAVTLTQALELALDELKNRKLLGNSETSVTTGIGALESNKIRYPFGTVSLIAARPGMGKSSALRASVKANCNLEVPSTVFSIEDTKETFAFRILADSLGIPVSVLINSVLPDEVIDRVDASVKAWAPFAEYVSVIDSREITADDMYAEVLRDFRLRDIRAAYFDYAQVVNDPDAASPKARVDKLLDRAVKVSGACKRDDRHCLAFILVSQIHRYEGELREVEELEQLPIPRMHNLKDSGDFEQRVKGPVLMLVNPSCYSETLPKDKIVCFVAKNNNGAVRPDSGLLLNWNGPTTTVY